MTDLSDVSAPDAADADGPHVETYTQFAGPLTVPQFPAANVYVPRPAPTPAPVVSPEHEAPADSDETPPWAPEADGDAMIDGFLAEGEDLAGELAEEHAADDAQSEAANDAPDEAPDQDGEPSDELDDSDEEEQEELDPEAVAAAERESRFQALVEERLALAKYSHPLARAVLTPEEMVISEVVERRASVWVPVSTLTATVVSAVAAVVLASRLGSDPSQLDGGQFGVVAVTVLLLAASFVTLLRAEVHFEKLRPKGRVVRADVADAYDAVRDAPRRMLEANAPHQVLVRVAGLLAPAERLVDAIVEYTNSGGLKVKAHPAYERLLRMRAEVEALEMMLDETEPDKLLAADAGEKAPLPKPEQVPEYESLTDIADFIDGHIDPLTGLPRP